MRKARDLTGNKYGRLTVVSRAESKTRRIKWNCICECGNTSIVSGENLMSGHTKSCGCLLSERRTSHGKSKTRLYNIWRKMKSRYTNKNETHYKDYGGRGIEVCWMNPPYGREIGKWVEKAYKSNAVVVCLVPARTDTKWWHEFCMKSKEIRLVQGRLKFGGSKNSAPFPSAVVVFDSNYHGKQE